MNHLSPPILYVQVIKVLSRYFPYSLDQLPQEQAFFNGHKPLLLGAITWEDVATLLSGPSRGVGASVDFGAHQVGTRCLP